MASSGFARRGARITDQGFRGEYGRYTAQDRNQLPRSDSQGRGSGLVRERASMIAENTSSEAPSSRTSEASPRPAGRSPVVVQIIQR
ncbi:hypothetical protein EGU77_13265 [Pseudomonas syringae pv. theae]|nr:hypothetical protein [Pseudomonas syringae pv. theae]MBL3836526.1 hypothetical protein [Pseudomonas syringae pv. theae]MBL3867659.1 hypothetical protein [Pseudomonas syringae pv. theae]MBL3873130.1 hypothetical protein [Pseudomonas syringae pv. theae]